MFCSVRRAESLRPPTRGSGEIRGVEWAFTKGGATPAEGVERFGRQNVGEAFSNLPSSLGVVVKVCRFFERWR